MGDNEDNISSSVLQGFTCTSVATLSKRRIRRLIRASRRRGKRRVKLKETQLTCMYNQIREESGEANNFSLYPQDVLLYYSYALVPQVSCRSYFQELAVADFSVFSETLSFKRAELFTNARSCLNIVGSGLSRDNVEVLGNMCCTLDGSVISNSDPVILETLKNCPDFNDDQVVAMETLLFSGTTIYGAPATWNRQTLEDLGILPLYLTRDFYVKFDKRTKRRFLRSFRTTLRQNGVSRRKRRRMKKAIRDSLKGRRGRAVDSGCTEGEITPVVIRDAAFPFDYIDEAQFRSCLDATTARDNLASITQAVDSLEFLRIVLDKLREAYGAGSSIPEAQVQVLGPASRTATADDVSVWNITEVDTLAALMSSADGNWEDPALPVAIISKYLRHPGNSLGTAELNSIGGDNVCFLDVSLLGNISESSIRNANALTVTNCTIEKKRTLFSIAEAALSVRTRADVIPTSNFQLLQSYLGGADENFVGRLARSSINMDLATFTSLDPDVVADLSVAQVEGLLGNNVGDLKAYENQSLVRSWISRQLQSELDGLGVNITGGRVTPAVTTATVAPSSGSTAGGGMTGGVTPGGVTPGAVTPGAVTPGGVTPGGVTPGAVTPGGVTPGGVTPGGAMPTTTTTAAGGPGTRPDSLCLLTLLILIFTLSQHVLSV